MDAKIQNLLGISIISALLLFVAVSFWYVASFSKSAVPQRTFQVQGEGKVVAVPDVAELSFGVLTEGGKNLSALQKQNSEKVNAIIAFLKEQGVEEKDIKTQSYNISPRYQYYSCPPVILKGEESAPVSRPCPPSEIIGYSVSQSTLVKVRDLDKAGDIVAGVVDRGANTVSGPTFTIDDPAQLENEARAEAIKKAKEKAQAIAQASGFRLGKLLTIQEGISYPQPIPFYAIEQAKGGETTPPQIEPGSQEVRANVTLTYEIK